MSPTQFAITDAELEQFDDFTVSAEMQDHAMDASTLQGLSAALAVGPRVISPAIWLPWVWDLHSGLRPPAFASMDQANQMLMLVMRQYNAVVSSLEPQDGAGLQLLFRRSPQWGAAEFCQGFMIGLNLAFEDWAPLMDAQPELIAPLRTFADCRPEVLMALGDTALSALARRIEPNLLHIRDFWRAQGQSLPPLQAQQAWDAVREQLAFFRKPFPHDAIALAHARRESVAPNLVRVLEDLSRDPTPARDGNYMLHLFAMALLACWRDTAAYRPLLALAHGSPELIDDLFGDALHELYGRALASVCDGDLQPLQAMVVDPTVSVWVRYALLDAWKIRVLEGDADAAEFERFLLDLGQRNAERLQRAEREPEGAEMLDDVASQACDIGSTLLLEPVRQWFEQGLIDTQSIDRHFFEREVALSHAERLGTLRRHGHSYIDDVAAEISTWASYTEQDSHATPRVAPTTPMRSGPKIGRNDPCPCGSGRKYKKCHGAN